MSQILAFRPPEPRVDPPDKDLDDNKLNEVGEGEGGEEKVKDVENQIGIAGGKEDGNGKENETKIESGESSKEVVAKSSSTTSASASASKSKSTLKRLGDALRLSSASRFETLLLLLAWVAYIVYNLGAYGNGSGTGNGRSSGVTWS